MHKKKILGVFLIFLSLSIVGAVQYIINDPTNSRYSADNIGYQGTSIEDTLNDDDNNYLWCKEVFQWKNQIYIGAYGYSDYSEDHAGLNSVNIEMTWMAESWMGLGSVDDFRLYFKLSNGEYEYVVIRSDTPSNGVEYTDVVTLDASNYQDLFNDILDDGEHISEVRLYCDVGYWGFHSPLYLNIDEIKITYTT